MTSDPLYAVLSPQQWRVWRILCDGEVHTIEDLFRQARPLHDPAKFSRRRKQQIVGAVLVRINEALRDQQDCTTQAVPGAPRHTYQLRTRD
jgi:hypothetical protein